MVHEAAGGVYTVRLDDERRIEASLRGRVKRSGPRSGQVVIGDRVRVEPVGDGFVISSVEPRRTVFVRRGRGGRSGRILVANLDRVLAVVALHDPPATRELVDRLLVLVEAGGMKPVVVVNKVDLAEDANEVDELVRPAREVGYRILELSAARGDGVDELRILCSSGTSALVGPSGVGKSSLLNALEPGLGLRIGELSRKTGTGKHTTVGSRLIGLSSGGMVADTPGFSDVGLWGVPLDELPSYFPEIEEIGAECHFRTCSHRHEPGCAVIAAVEEGRIAASRHRSYLTLREEAAEALPDWG